MPLKREASSEVLFGRDEMLARGAYGYLHKALERYIPLDKIIVLAADPVCTDWCGYSLVKVRTIEVVYSSEDQAYLAFNAGSVMREARERGERYIHAFVEPDGGCVGADALVRLPATDDP
jgi:hypothetical protein